MRALSSSLKPASGSAGRFAFSTASAAWPIFFSASTGLRLLSLSAAMLWCRGQYTCSAARDRIRERQKRQWRGERVEGERYWAERELQWLTYASHHVFPLRCDQQMAAVISLLLIAHDMARPINVRHRRKKCGGVVEMPR